MNWYLKVLKNYADFSGRARRKEFWMFTLFNIGICIIFGILDGILNAVFSGIGILSYLYLLVVLVPSIAVAVRRLHDTNRSGWWVLIGLTSVIGRFLPLIGGVLSIIGGIILLVFYVQNGTPGTNRFGNDPKTEPNPI